MLPFGFTVGRVFGGVGESYEADAERKLSRL